MSEVSNINDMAVQAVSNFTKLYEQSVVSAGTFNDSDFVVVDCHLSGKRLVITPIPKNPSKIGVGVGIKETGSISGTSEFDKKTFSTENIFKLMQENFRKSQ